MSSAVELVHDASDLEAFAAPMRTWLNSDDLDALWRLNRKWIYMKPTGARLRIRDYIELHDPALQPFLTEFFGSMDCRMITFSSFIKSLALVVNSMLDWLETTVDKQTVFLWGGESFGKSNTWILLLFWDMYRQRFRDNRFSFRVITSLYDQLNVDGNICLYLDDCMYSGRQMHDSLRRVGTDVIVCPFISKTARALLDSTFDIRQKKETQRGDTSIIKYGKDMVFTTRSIPGDSSNVVDFELYTVDGYERTTLLQALRAPLVVKHTWVFEHKIADSLSIYECMFNSAVPIQVTGETVVTNLKTDQVQQINIEIIPDSEMFPLIEPCPEPSERCNPCYAPYYKQNTYLIATRLEHILRSMYMYEDEDVLVDLE